MKIPNPTSRTCLLIILAVTSLMLFWKIGRHDLAEWDESRNGINAYEMYHNGDYINIYFAGEPDTWDAKPPLMLWLIVLCYKIFGFNEFALRLPAAISAVLFFLYFYKLIDRYTGHIKAFLTCLVLMSCKAIIGWHVGTNGDFDAPLLFFLTASAYYFSGYIDFGRKNDIYLAALCAGLAFYTKGTAGFLFLPGFLVYTLFRHKIITVLKDYRMWLSLILFFMIVASWILLVYMYGIRTEQSHYGSKNAIETLFVHDTYKRLTSETFDGRQTNVRGLYFFLVVMDVRMNVWNYVLYLVAVLFAFLLLRRKAGTIIVYEDKRSLLLAACISFPIILILMLARNPYDWYMIPALPYLAYFIACGSIYIYAILWKPFIVIISAVFLFAFARHCIYLHTQPENLHKLLSSDQPLLAGHKPIILTASPTHQVKLYLAFINKQYIRIDSSAQLHQYKEHTILYQSENRNIIEERNNTDTISEGGYTLARIK